MKKNSKRPFNARIILQKAKKRVYRQVKSTSLPPDSFERKYKGQWIHELGLDLEGKLWPLIPWPAEEGKSPIDYYATRHGIDGVVERFIDLTRSTTEKVKFGIFVAVCAMIVFALFLIGMSVMGRQ